MEKVAVNTELIVSLADSNVKKMLKVWFTSIKGVGIPNYLVVALDKEIVDFCQMKDVPVYQPEDVPVYRRDPDDGIDYSSAGTGTGQSYAPD